MGNCMQISKQQQQQHEEDRTHDPAAEFVKKGENNNNNNGMKVKILLKKEELEMLLIGLRNNKGMKLEDLLVDLEKNRVRKCQQSGAAAVWKPSLDSIMECPEVHDEWN